MTDLWTILKPLTSAQKSKTLTESEVESKFLCFHKSKEGKAFNWDKCFGDNCFRLGFPHSCCVYRTGSTNKWSDSKITLMGLMFCPYNNRNVDLGDTIDNTILLYWATSAQHFYIKMLFTQTLFFIQGDT